MNLMTLRKVTNGDQSKPHKSSKGVSGSLIFEQFLWPTPITFEGLFLCRWIHLIKVFSMILMMSSLEFWYASGVFFLSLLFHSCNFLNDMREREREKGRKERKISHRHTEAPMTTPSVPYKRSRQDKSNDTKENHER